MKYTMKNAVNMDHKQELYNKKATKGVRFAEKNEVKTFQVNAAVIEQGTITTTAATTNIDSVTAKAESVLANTKAAAIAAIAAKKQKSEIESTPSSSSVDQSTSSSTATASNISNTAIPTKGPVSSPQVTHPRPIRESVNHGSNANSGNRNRLRSCCKSFVNGLFFSLFLAMFLVPFYLAIISPLLSPSSESDSQTSTVSDSESIPQSQTSSLGIETENNSPFLSNQTTSPSISQTSSTTSRSGWDGYGVLSFLYDIQRTLSSHQCQQHFSQPNRDLIEDVEASPEKEIGVIDYYDHAIPVKHLLEELTFFDIEHSVYTVANGLVEETKQLLPTTEQERVNNKKVVKKNNWVRTVDEDLSLSVETVVASDASQWKKVQERKEREKLKICQKDEKDSESCVAELDLEFIDIESRSSKDEKEGIISNQCRLLSRSYFTLSTIYTLEQVFQEMVTSAGLEMLLSLHGQPHTDYRHRDRESATNSAGEKDAQTSGVLSASYRPILSFEWYPGSIEVFYVPITSFVSFYRRELIVLKIIDRTTNTMIIKSITIPEMTNLIHSRVVAKQRDNLIDETVEWSTEVEEKKSPSKSKLMKETLQEVEREMDNLLESWQSYALSLSDNNMKSFITSLQQQVYKQISAMKEEMIDDDDEDEDDEKEDTDNGTVAEKTSQVQGSTNFFIAIQLTPLNATSENGDIGNMSNGDDNETSSHADTTKDKKNGKKETSKGKTKKDTKKKDSSSSTTTTTTNPYAMKLPPVLPLGVKYLHEVKVLRYEDNQQMFSWFVWFKEYVDQNAFFKNLQEKMIDYFDSDS